MKCCNRDCTQGRYCPDARPATWSELLGSIFSLLAYLAVLAGLIGISWLVSWAVWSLR